MNKYKFDIGLQTTMEEEVSINKWKGNTFYKDSINIEMKNFRLAFKLLVWYEKAPVGYKKSTYHWIFDIKMNIS